MLNPLIKITPEILNLIAKIDEFKGVWKAIGNLSPERLDALKHVATIESIGSSTRIEGVKLSDREIELLLSGLDKKSFGSRDEQEVAGYADVMNIVFASYKNISFTENYVLQLHKMLLEYSSKDIRLRGEYKKMPNHVEAFDHDGKSLGVIFETSSPFDTPKDMEELMEWTARQLKEKIFIKLSRLSRQIIDLVKDHGELSISEIESITKANRNTLKKKLSELVKKKYLLTQGRGKGTRYIIGIK